MNDNTPEPLDPDDRFGAADDTLADDDQVVQVPPQARPWLAQQRFVHGMLRALHTADANAREARVQAVMRGVSAWPALARRFALAAALLLGTAAALYVLWPNPARLPRADAMVAKAIAALGQPIDREFELTIDVDRAGRAITRQMQITLRPGRRFLVVGDAPFGKFKAGSDGTMVWFKPALGPLHMEVPLSEARRLTERLGDVLDLGYLDLETMLRRLPQDTELRCVGREPGGIRVEATGTVTLRQLELRSIQMVVDDDTGLLRQIEATAVGQGRGRESSTRLRYRHVADQQLGEDAYRRPW